MLRGYDIIKPGLKCRDLFKEIVATVQREGIPHFARSHVGHGIGVDGYDPPNIAESSADVLEENMVVCIETPYYELGFAGLQVEDMVRVTKDGAESLMSLPTGLKNSLTHLPTYGISRRLTERASHEVLDLPFHRI